MAFLKSSRITGITARDVAVRGFRQTNNINLGTRAYNKHEVLLADNYSIKGDVNVSDNLILSKLSDDGNAITITGDSVTRTISGSGSIEGATLAPTPNASLTGMTGELGSAVTGRGITSGTITSGVNFPTGHVINVVESATTQNITRHYTTMGSFSTPFTGTISNCLSTSKILVSCNLCVSGSADTIAMFALYDTTNAQYVTNNNLDGHCGTSVIANGRVSSVNFQTLYTPPTLSSQGLTIEIYAKGSSSAVQLNQRGGNDAYGRGTSNIILMEIAG